MNIPPNIPPEHIVPEMRATERYGAIRELLQHLIQVGTIPQHAEESLFAAVHRREEVMSTGVGFGIAIPHTASDAVTERVMALGRSKAGINFVAVDGRTVNTVILMISPSLSS